MLGELWADFVRFADGILGFLALFIGRFRWTAPPWLTALGHGIASGIGHARRQPRTAAALVGAVVITLAGGSALSRYYHHRVRPHEVAVSVAPPPLTDFTEGGKPQPAHLRFAASVAPLAAIHKEPASGITMSPRLEGTWRWDDDRELTFTPRADWPVGQRVLVTLAPRGLLADGVRLSRYQLPFDTPRFEARLPKAEFYQDPTDPRQKKVVATVTFTHPVDSASLEPRLSATLLQRGEKTGRPLSLRVTYDKWKGSAFVHTEPLAIPERDAVVTLTVDRGVHAARGGPPTTEALSAEAEVPGLYSFFRVGDFSATNVDNERGEPDQVLLVETSVPISEAEAKKHVQAWLLPLRDPASPDEKEADRPHAWSQPELVGDALRTAATAVALAPVAGEREFETVHSFRYHAPPGRWLFVQFSQGASSYGGYLLAETRAATLQIPALPQAIKILGAGAVVSLSGERKVPVYARDIPAVRFEIGRVLPNQIQHLVSQSSGRFERPGLDGWRFGADNLSERFVETRAVDSRGPGKPTYLALDLARYFDAPGAAQRRGLFLLHAAAFDPEHDQPLGPSDDRLILVTDLGIVVKDAQDGSHDLFVQSIRDGAPVAGAQVAVLGKNGLPTLTALTDDRGHAPIGSFRKLEREQAPTLYLVRKGADESFLPIGRYDRYLDFTRFDIGGAHERPSERKLAAYVFSDRGIYRPGDEIRVGLVVKPDGWKESLDGLPIVVRVTDPRGATVQSKVLRLDAVGFREIRQATLDTSPTGTWVVSAFVMHEGRPGALLGSTTVRVREFAPDRMKIRARVSEPAARGWVAPGDLKGLVTLETLFGTAAADHKVHGRLVLTPGLPNVGAFRDYSFTDPLRAKEELSDDLDDARTNERGEARFDFRLGRFAAATYRLHFLAEGFEAEGGRSVAGDAEVTVSPLPFLLGWKADGDLGYVGRGSKRSVHIVALSPRAEATAASGLRALLVQRKYVSVLMRQDNNTWKYQSVLREVPLGEAAGSQAPGGQAPGGQAPGGQAPGGQAIDVPAAGLTHALATDKPGDFAWLIKNARDEELLRVNYSVAGRGNLTRSLEKDAELQLSLKASDVPVGGSLEVQIKAPFVGAGLVTIERDRVYAFKWFKSDTTSSVQTIEVPPELEGNGYLSVSMLRDLGSPEVFMSPLSYGVVPFSISKASRTAQVTLKSADLARPGEPYVMRYKTDRPAKIVVFAVDEGILKVAGYKSPDPLGLFFEKRALEVRTGQILDLVLPEYSRLVAASAAPGGDAERLLAAHLNPFKRRRDTPAAYWSGILDAGPEEKELRYQVPDSFAGTLRVMAVAVSADAIGTFEKKATVRGDFVISPNVPSFVSPGDELDATVSVTNTAAGSGKGARVKLTLGSGPELEVVGPASVELAIDELAEGHASFHLRATRHLGSAALTFTASSGARSARLQTDLSVRPPTPFLTTFHAGRLDPGKSADSPVDRNLYPEHRLLGAGISALPLGLARGLAGYLEKFPHGCTEQLVSQGVPAMVFGRHPELGADLGLDPSAARAAADRAVARVVEVLATRQNSDGAFGLWAASPLVAAVPSAWAVEFLLEARERGFEVPAGVLRPALAWLSSIASAPGPGDSLADERLRAQAIYLLTRSGMVTSALAAGIARRLESEHKDAWEQDAAAAWLAGTYALLHDDKPARAIIERMKLGQPVPGWVDYYDQLTRDAILLAVIARHFPEVARRIGAAEIAAIAQPIFAGSYNTLSSARTILALERYGVGASAGGGAAGLRIAEVLDGGATRALALPANLLPWASYTPAARALRFDNGSTFPAFWLATQSGFEIDPPRQPIAQRLEVVREYTDAQGHTVTKVRLGDEIQVHLRVRALGAPADNLALVDLLPGGFEVVVQPQAAPSEAEAGGGRAGGGPYGEAEGEGDGEGHRFDAAEEPAAFALPIALAGSTFALEYGDVREDRVVLYGAAALEAREFVYALKAVAQGRFAVAPILGESMYDRGTTARGLGGSLEVTAR